MIQRGEGTAKAKALKALEENRGQVISGEQLAASIGVSRAAVWKAMESLRREGYPISASTNKGYVLADVSDLLSAQGMLPFIDAEVYPYGETRIHTYKSLESTNTTAKKKAFEGADSGTVILAEEQTKGRGRLGRSFFSPPKAGLYMSIIIKPDFGLNKSLLVTTAASVAVCRAIKKVCGLETQIKWVNDIFYEGKKVCGILTEAITNFESGTIDALVVGIGVNCSIEKDSFPEDIRETAGSLTANIFRNQLAAEIINRFFTILKNFSEGHYPEFMDEYRRRSIVLRKDVYIHKNVAAGMEGERVKAKAIDITDDGGLIVIYEGGVKETLASGEISLRLAT